MGDVLERFSLKGKLALVTGSRRGIGRSLAFGLAGAGARIVSLDRNEPSETREEILSLGGEHYWKKIDFQAAKKYDIEKIISEIAYEIGSVDILVNNAGICPRANLVSFTEELWRETVNINMDIVWFLSQAVAAQMLKRQSGKIINLASMLSFQGGTSVPAYAASKHAILGITKAMANELADQGINVNAIAPGYMQTDLTADLESNSERNRSITSRIPAGQWGRPEDLQGACIYLASAASDYVNGICIPVDGGWLAR